MIKVTMGLLLGVGICMATGYVMIPKIKQNEYNLGLAIGRKQGMEAGMTAGTDKGREQARAEYRKEQEAAQASARANEESQRQNAAKTRKPAPKQIQNWHVRGNQIAEPIRETPADDTPA